MPSFGERKATAIRLGSYEILHMFAKGGMAELYLARSVAPEGFEKLVVLKKILPSFAENARFVRQFLDEAKLAASLDHPNIAHVYDLGRVDGNYFFTMEYVHGQDVRKLLRRETRTGKLPIDHAVSIARSVAGALHYAHERRGPDGSLLGIVHRDVSPSNIVVSYEGAVKLLDFGVAKAANSTVKTHTGTLKGNVAYMSPEQAKGAPIDRRSDIFSAGIVLWEMVATQRLYKGDNDLATIQLIINQPPPPLATVRPECPAELDRIIHKALARDPAQRYQTAQELQSELDELARETKLNQSSIALSTHMSTLFAPEIQAWRDAQASGVSLTEHIVATSSSKAEPAPPPSGGFDEDEDDEDDDDASDGSVSGEGLEADGERTERTEVPRLPNPAIVPPPAVARVPTPPAPPPALRVAAEPAPPAPQRKKRKKAKEPKSWASEPSIVLDVGLVVAIADEPEPEPTNEAEPATAAVEPPAIARKIPSERDLRTMLMTAVADPTERSRRALWIVGAVVVVAGAVGGMWFVKRGSSAAPAVEQRAVVHEDVAPPPVAPPPVAPPPVAPPVDTPVAQPAPAPSVVPHEPPIAKPPSKKRPKRPHPSAPHGATISPGP